MWELRRPIDVGHIFEGSDLGSVLWSHCATFERITGVPTRMSQSGIELQLTTDMSVRLFSIAHNALANAFMHASAGKVEVRLECDADQIRLSIVDDGVGLPDNYGDRGRGIKGMNADARRMDGILIVESPNGVGTAITCVVPYGNDLCGE